MLTLCIPDAFDRTGEKYHIPDGIKALESKYDFKITRVPEDKGPITKVYYSLLEYSRPDDIIISIDDDICYHDRFIEELLDAHKNKPECLLGFMGNDPPRRPFVHAEYVQSGHSDQRIFTPVTILGGYRGILFPRKLVHADFFAGLMS